MIKTAIQFAVAFLMSFGLMFVFHMIKFPQSWDRCMMFSFGLTMGITNLLMD